MKYLVTKKNVLIVSGIVVILFLLLDSIGTFRLCGGVEYGSCMDKLHDFFGVFLPFFPLFLFSLITYKMREEIYDIWFRFARWSIPLSLLLILMTPSDTGGGGFGPQLSFGKGDTAFLTSFIFTLVSLILIVWKWFALRGKK